MQASLIVFCPPHTDLNLQREMDNLRSERDKTLLALRELEMGNDELERNERYCPALMRKLYID